MLPLSKALYLPLDGNKDYQLKTGDIIAVSANKLIKLATLSDVSHVAIALNDEKVIEILPSGVRKVSLQKCISDCTAAILYERPMHLAPLDAAILEEEYQKHNSAKYSFIRMLYSGYIPIARNFFHVAVLISLIYIFSFNAFEYLPISILLAAYSPIVWLIQKACSYKSFLEWLKIPKWLIEDLPGYFCSSLVVDFDTKAKGVIALHIIKNHEPRPNDVVKACEDLKYKAVVLKK